MNAAHFRIVALLELASRPQAATVSIERRSGLFMVRVLHHKRVYTLPLANVASDVVRGIIRAELREKQKAKREARKARRGR